MAIALKEYFDIVTNDLKEIKIQREVWDATDPLLVHTSRARLVPCQSTSRQNIFCRDRDWTVTGTAGALHG